MGFRILHASRAGGRLLLLAAIVTLVMSACAPVTTTSWQARAPETAVSVPGFVFARDTFAFPNEIRSRHPDVPDLYANYCFVLARGLRQFFAFARFDPGASKLEPAGYVDRVRRIAARPPWREAPPGDDRIVIPGYANLREFSAAEEPAVKEGLGGRFWTLVHWTNWRVTFPVTGGHQTGVAEQIVDDLAHGRLVQLLVTNWPKPELNHTVVVFEARATGRGLDLVVWDPNDPGAPGLITFLDASHRFWATRVYDTQPGVIRAFRMSYSWLL